jgi:hypothetical protein
VAQGRGAGRTLRSRLLLGLLDFFLVWNVLVPAGAGIQRSGGAVVAIPRVNAFTPISPAVGTCKAVMSGSAMSSIGVARISVMAMGKCRRDYEEASEDGTDQELAMERLATRGSAHGLSSAT